jgi:hypothetical protein
MKHIMILLWINRFKNFVLKCILLICNTFNLVHLAIVYRNIKHCHNVICIVVNYILNIIIIIINILYL